MSSLIGDTGSPAVFLDRDGVINENRADYVRSADDFVLLPSALKALAVLRAAGLRTVVISNQAGVGRGLIPPAELSRIDRKLHAAANDNDGAIERIYYCTHAKDEGCDCRKPGIGLLLKASDELGVRLPGSYLIGDALSDIECGQRAGLRTVLVLSGRTSIEETAGWAIEPDHIADDLLDAVEWVLNNRALP